MVEKSLEWFITQGVLGILCLILMAVIRHLQARRDAEHEARLNDQKAATNALLAMSDKTHAALDKVSEVLELVRHQPAQPYPPKEIGRKIQP